MEFSSRGFQRNNARPATSAGSSAPSPSSTDGPTRKKGFHKLKSSRPISILGIIFFVSALILIIAVIIGLSAKSSEKSIVNSDEYQAVFLNGGQAYFGKIDALNERYIDLKDIYYISTQGQNGDATTQANISLVKLGSELHCPQDRMVINREQVLFWENLNDDGKVVKAIKQWREQNPDGQKCNDQTTQQQGATSPDQSSNKDTTGTDDAATQGTDSPATSDTANDNSSNSSSNQPVNNNTGSDTPTGNNPTSTP